MTDNITLPRDVGLHIRNSLRGIVNASDDDCGEEKCRECAPVRVMRESLAALDAALAEPTETFAESLFRRSWEAHRAALAEPDAICSAKDNEAALERVANRVKPGQVKGLLPEPEQKPDALRRDAARYRWLKGRAQDHGGYVCFGDVRYPAPIPDCTPFDAIDAAIDAAMQEDKT